VTGTLRMTFGSTALLAGFDFLVAGNRPVRHRRDPADARGKASRFKGASAKINVKVVIETWKELPKYWLTSIRSSAVGCFMGHRSRQGRRPLRS
jgi:TctA family transporter